MLNIDRRSSYAALKQEICTTFLNAVERRLPDPVAISVSGGIDSMAMVGAARRLRPEGRILTFSAGDAPDDPELIWARRVADRFRTEHHEVIMEPDDVLSIMPTLVWHLEDPIARTETLMAYKLCAAVAPLSRVVLRGDGADGLFGGMSRHQLLALAGRIPPARSFLADIYRYTQSATAPSSFLGRLAIQHYFAKKIPEVPVVLGVQEASSTSPLPAGPEMLNEVIVQGPRHALPMLLQKVERMHGAFGVRTVSPFVDHGMIRLASQIPSRFKHDGLHDKKIFREAMQSLLPPEFASRPKYPQRIRETTAFCDALEVLSRRWLDDGAVTLQYYDPGSVSSLLKRPSSGLWKPEHAMRIWTLVGAEIWARTFLIGDGGEPVQA